MSSQSDPPRSRVLNVLKKVSSWLAGGKGPDVLVAEETILRRWSASSVAFAIVLTIMGGTLSWRSMHKANEESDWVSHTQTVTTGLDASLAHMIDIETGARGFAATGDDEFLNSFSEGKRTIFADLNSLRLLTSDNPTQQKRLDELGLQCAARLEVAQRTIDERRRSGKVPQTGLFLEGKHLMDAVRKTISEMQTEESSLLEQRSRSAKEARERTANFLAATALVGVILLALAGFITGREISRSARIRSQIRTLNATLELRVEERSSELRDSRERLEGIIGSAMDAIITVDEGQTIVYLNPAAERTFGYISTEVIGHPLNLLIPQRFHQRHTDHLRNFGATNDSRRMAGNLGRLSGLHADGTEFPLEASISSTEVSGRKLFTAIVRDITDRVQAEEAVRKQSSTLKLVLDSMQEGLVAADENGTFLIWNRVATELIGRGPEDVPIEDWSRHYEVYSPDGTTLLSADQLPLLRAMRGEIVNVELMVRSPRFKDGLSIEFSGWPLKDETGAVRGGLVIFRDVTERRVADREIRKLNNELEDRVQQRTAQLQTANKDLEAFTYSVAHDLRAPLRHMAGFSKILMEEFGARIPSEAQHYLRRLEEGTRRMGVLVDDLLNLAHVGRRDLGLQVAGLNSVVEEIIKRLKPDTGDRQIEWKIGTLPYVECDISLMKVVFENLLANAIKFTRPRTPAIIEVGREDKDGVSVVYVRDNGVGFSMKYADKLFGVFQRLHRAEDFEGTGVGLATVQRIIQKHGGRIWAQAELDKGATFYFSLGKTENDELKANAAISGVKA
jgi:PAS domain S-box-containing protein